MVNGQVPDDAEHDSSEIRKRLQATLNLSPVGIGVTRLRDGMMVDFNEAILEIIGYSRTEVIGRTSSELNVWNDLDERAEAFARIAAGEVVREMPSTIRRKNGEIRHVRFSATTFVIDGEKHMIGTLRDVSAEVLAERDRQIAEKRLRLSLSIMPITVFHQDRDLRYTAITNPQIRQPVEAIVGHFDTDLFDAADAALLTTIKRRVLASGRGERHEIMVHLSGQRLWFDTLVEPELDAHGSIVGIVGAGADISERKQREERYRTVLEDQTELIARYRPDGVMVYANEIYCRFFGKSDKEIIGNNWRPAAHPDDIPEIEAQLSRLSPKNPVVSIENRVFAHDGSEHWMQFINRAFFDAQGRIFEIQSVGRDVTARRRAESELSLYKSKLLALLEDADRLREKQRKDIAREIHDQFGAILMSIGFRIESLRRRLDESPAVHAELREIRVLVRKAHESARTICNNLRPPALDDLGLIPTCRWYLKDWSVLTGISSRGRFAELPEVLSESLSTDLFRVFQELLTNVARHSAATSVRASLASGRQGLRLRVADDGCGFDPDARCAGYGLLGIKERMARHGGRVAIRSAPALTVMTISLPLPRGD